MKKLLLSVISAGSLSFFASCGPDIECYNGYYRNVTSYGVAANRYTPKGVGLDDPKNPEHVLDAGEVDWQVDGLERCLNKNFRESPVIDAGEAAIGWCFETRFYFGVNIKRGCIIVKVPDDIYKSECTGRLLFPCDVDEQLCRAKGFEPDSACPCNCRAIVQDNNYVITEPKLEVFRAELARVVTNCNNPWVVTQIKACLSNPHFSE